MKDSYQDKEILENKEIAPGIFKLIVRSEEYVKPGQFYMLRSWGVNDPFLARPISVHNYEGDKLTFLYAKVGKGTDILSTLKSGDIINILGPLGEGFKNYKDKKIALVAGGIGIAPLLYLAKKLEGKVDLYAGFKNRTYCLESFEDFVDNIYFSTEDGSEGHKGFITDILEVESYDLIISCGPTPMMKLLKELCDNKTKLVVSLENSMACGIGACMGCTVETKNGMKRVCKEGPVLQAEEVIFND